MHIHLEVTVDIQRSENYAILYSLLPMVYSNKCTETLPRLTQQKCISYVPTAENGLFLFPLLWSAKKIKLRFTISDWCFPFLFLMSGENLFYIYLQYLPFQCQSLSVIHDILLKVQTLWSVHNGFSSDYVNFVCYVFRH